MANKYFIKPTAKVLNSEENTLLAVDTNYYNSRCENALIFIKNFTLAILIKKNADLSFIQSLDKHLRDSILKLNQIVDEIEKYSDKNNDKVPEPLQQILTTVNNTVAEYKSQVNSINQEELKRVGYANILDKVDGLIELVRAVSIESKSAAGVLNKSYEELIAKITNIVTKINEFIISARNLALSFINVLYCFDDSDVDQKSLYEKFEQNSFLKPDLAGCYFSFDLNYDDKSDSECDFTKYFKNIHSETKFAYDQTKNIVISPIAENFKYNLENNQVISKPLDCQLWLVPISTLR